MRNTCRVRRIGPITILDLSGSITIGDGDITLRRVVRAELDRGSKHILINLGRVRWVDAAGVGQLVACYRQAQARGATVKLLNASNRVAWVLGLVRLATVFEIHRDEREALASFVPPSRSDRPAA